METKVRWAWPRTVVAVMVPEMSVPLPRTVLFPRLSKYTALLVTTEFDSTVQR